MTRAILIYRLPQERSEHLAALHGLDFFCAVWDLDNWLRAQLKYGHNFQDQSEALQAARDKLHECLTDKGIDLDAFE